MFNLFRLKRIPAFPYLQDYSNKHLYFRRIASWFWLNKQIVSVIDPNAPRFITMDPWPQKVFLAADGQKTVSDYIYAVANEYSGKIPELLDEVIIVELEKIIKEGIVEFCDNKLKPEEQYDRCKVLGGQK